MRILVSVLKDEGGQGIVEYALILALVAIIAVPVLKILGYKVSNALNSITLDGSSPCLNNGGNAPQGNAYGVCGK